MRYFNKLEDSNKVIFPIDNTNSFRSVSMKNMTMVDDYLVNSENEVEGDKLI